MATALKDSISAGSIPSANNMKFGIVVSEWNTEITNSLRDGALNALKLHGAKENNIKVSYVPGSIELTKGALIMSEDTDVDAVICLGCVIQGETRHFDYVCQSVTYGITQLNIDLSIPFIFGVLTTNDLQQAQDRAGGKYGDKGEESAIAAIKMVALGKLV